MNPADAAAAFATVVGLLADFASHRRAKSDHDYADFLSWLSENRHQELLSLMQQNGATAISIKALLHQDRADLIGKLDLLDRSLAKLASTIDGFQPLAMALRPDAPLSQQALRILREFNASGAGKALDLKTLSSRSLMLFEGGDGTIAFDDIRFADDDLNTLAELGLLRLGVNSNGKTMYIFTRAAAEFLKTRASDV